MKFKCKCGAAIHDITDNQKDKAWYYPDTSWFELTESLKTWEIDIRKVSKIKRSMFQCVSCNRIHLMDKNGKFVSFSPDDNISFGILSGL